MKKIFLIFMLLLSVVGFAQVGIGTTTPNASALLDVDSPDKGFLPPRMNTTQRDAINSGAPAEGLVIFNTDDNCLQWYNGTIWFNACDGATPPPTFPTGYNWCGGTPTEVVELISATGRTWMDRNLGASRAATGSLDEQAYGSLFQWGRFADGHQCVNRFAGDGITTSSVVTTKATTVAPFTGGVWDENWIGGAVGSWHTTDDTNLWQDVDGVNNPCPTGYRLPTFVELQDEVNAFASGDAAGAFTSLKFALAGARNTDGSLVLTTDPAGRNYGIIMSGTPSSSLPTLTAGGLFVDDDFSGGAIVAVTEDRVFVGEGYSVRCIKDQ